MIKSSKFLVSFAVIAALGSGSAIAASTKNVVLVHGAFADGSGWEGVSKILTHDGFHVAVVQEPETSLDEDVKATNRVIDLQSGPVVLVGHSYGGAIITEAGNNSKVASLVYIAAVVPDVGESTLSLGQKMPSATKAIRQTPDGYLYLDPALYHADFAPGASAGEAAFMASAQVLTAGAAFVAPIKNPSWKTKPSWAVVATEDRIINPDLERFMYTRAKSHTVEIKGAHTVYLDHAREVAKVIEAAAKS